MFKFISRILPNGHPLASLLSLAMSTVVTGFERPRFGPRNWDVWPQGHLGAGRGDSINSGSNIAAIVNAAPTGAMLF